MSDFDVYYAQNPVEVWDRNVWNEWDPVIAVDFQENAIFTPLILWRPLGTKAPTQVTGREALPGHVNYNPINVRQQYITADYLDSRERKITAPYRYGGKVQFEQYDELVNMWRAGGREGFVDGILRQHLNRSILLTHEMIARNGLIANTNVTNVQGGSAGFDFSQLSTTEAYLFDISVLDDVKLRLSFRTQFAIGKFGTFAAPVPGSNDMLIITTPAVMHGLWTQMDERWMMDLRDLGDARIINGGQVRYRGFTFVDGSWASALFNVGTIIKQVAITSPITAGDGAPDPDVSAAIDSTWYVGQSSSAMTHYIQCSAFGATDFAAGAVVSLHKARTSVFGVTNGVDFRDGMTMNLECYSADADTERLVFRSPVMTDFKEPWQDATFGTIYGFATVAQHVHPVYMIAARGGSLFAIRRKVDIHTPPAIDDFESVVRVSWDEYGGLNKWQGDLQEIQYCAGVFGNRGAVGIS